MLYQATTTTTTTKKKTVKLQPLHSITALGLFNVITGMTQKQWISFLHTVSKTKTCPPGSNLRPHISLVINKCADQLLHWGGQCLCMLEGAMKIPHL